jgi:hypothetical protein
MIEWLWAGAVGLAGLILAVFLIVLPERLEEWRQRLWETDSQGELPPEDQPPPRA